MLIPITEFTFAKVKVLLLKVEMRVKLYREKNQNRSNGFAGPE